MMRCQKRRLKHRSIFANEINHYYFRAPFGALFAFGLCFSAEVLNIRLECEVTHRVILPIIKALLGPINYLWWRLELHFTYASVRLNVFGVIYFGLFGTLIVLSGS